MDFHRWSQTYLTTVHGNSWDCPILCSLSQLLPDTLSDLISDTRSALLRDSLWWEADKEEGSNSDQAEHCSFDLCCFVPTQSVLCTSVHFMHCNQSSWLSVRRNCKSFYSITYLWPTSLIGTHMTDSVWNLIGGGHWRLIMEVMRGCPWRLQEAVLGGHRDWPWEATQLLSTTFGIK